MKIAFWSPLHGKGTTSNMLAVSLAMAHMHNSSILLTQTHYNYNNLEAPLIKEKYGECDDNFYMNIGTDTLIKYYKSGTLNGDIVSSCTLDIDDKISLLAGTRQLSRATYEDRMLHRLICRILACAEDYYEYIFIDVSSGENEQEMQVINEADAVIISLRQCKNDIDVLSESDVFKALDKSKVFYIFSEYDSNSKYSLKNLRSIYQFLNSNNSGVIPYSTSYLDAIYDERVYSFITMGLRQRKLEPEFFFECICKAANDIESFLEAKGGTG